MALTLLHSGKEYDFEASPPTTPVVQPPFWDFRPSFNPKPRPWSSGTTSVTSSMFTQIVIDSTDQIRPRTARPGPHGQMYTTHPIPAVSWRPCCKPNSTKRTVCYLQSAQNLRLLRSKSSTAECAWMRFQKNSSRVSTHVATPF